MIRVFTGYDDTAHGIHTLLWKCVAKPETCFITKK